MNSNKKFISFEGIDGSGKTTQINLLCEKLIKIGEKVSVFREPGGTIISEKIRGLLLDKTNYNLSSEAETLLFLASRNQLITEKLKNKLDKGEYVIFDRFNDSTIAYQGYGFGLDIKHLKILSNFATFGLEPYKTFFLDISVEESLIRRSGNKSDRIEQKGEKYLNKVREGFKIIAKENPKRIIEIDALNGLDELSKFIWSKFKEIYDIKV
tara:strand:- start:472 stop:1104 length:633 start_codon:yes stop_codon:yes gene_type:complete